MPSTDNQGARIYWDEQGEGDPLLLIMGLGYASPMWYRTRPLLSEHFRTIAFDNRGVGRSDVPPGPYPIALMAADAAAVLQASGCQAAHIFGVSMGGMIAQEFALQYPGRVRSLILGCTAAGGPQAVRAEREVTEFLVQRANQNQAEAAKASVPYIYDSGTPAERIAEDLAMRMQCLPSPEAYLAQLQGIFSWEAYSRLDQINAPTLVIHGLTDRLVPSENSKLIASRIRSAQLVLLPRAGHIFATDQPEAAHQAIMEFLAPCEPAVTGV